MRIAIINVTAQSGSTGKIAYGMYRGLQKDGHKVRLFYGRNDKVQGDPNVIRIGTDAEVYVHGALSRLTGLQGYYSAAATRYLIRELEAFQPDLVQLYNLHGYYLQINLLLNYLKEHEIPTVYSMLDEYPYLGRCCYSFECDQFQTGCAHCTCDKASYPSTLFLRQSQKIAEDKKRIYDYFEHICYAAPQWVLERAQSSYLLKGKEMFCVDEYVDTENLFYPRSEYHKLPERLLNIQRLRGSRNTSQGKAPKIVLTVAPYSNPRKGGHYFLEAAKRFLAGDSSHSVTAGKSGDGFTGAAAPSQSVNSLNAEGSLESSDSTLFVYVGMDTLGVEVPENCIAVGFIKDQDKLAEFYSVADVFVCTSLADTMPNVCLDALAAGTPVIGFDNTGIPYVAKEPLGHFVESENVTALCEAIAAAPRKDAALIEQCRTYARERYSPQTYYQKMLEIYDKMIR